MNKTKFEICDKVLVKYANGKKVVGRVEFIPNTVGAWHNGQYVKSPVYKVKIEGNKRLKKCFEFELEPYVEEKKVEEKKPTKQTYNVHYSFYLSDSIEVEAESEVEAKEIVDGMIEAGEIGNLNEMDVGDSNIWVD